MQICIEIIRHKLNRLPHNIKKHSRTKFHAHVSDLGMIHTYIKPRTPRLNGKVERSHLTDQREFYQLIDYNDDIDLRRKLVQWEDYYNFIRPHSAHYGKHLMKNLSNVC